MLTVLGIATGAGLLAAGPDRVGAWLWSSVSWSARDDTGAAVPLAGGATSPDETQTDRTDQPLVTEAMSAQGVTEVMDAQRVDPATPQDLVRRGQQSVARGELDRGIEDFTAALRADRQFAAARVSRGEAWVRKGVIVRGTRGESLARSHFDRALVDFNEAIRLSPGLAAAHYDRGDVLVKTGAPEGAIADFDEAIRLEPENALAYRYRGAARVFLGDIDLALADLSKSIELGGASGLPLIELFLAHSSRSLLYESKAQLDRAAADLSRTIEIYLQNPGFAGELRRDWGAGVTATMIASIYQRRARIYAGKSIYDHALTDLASAIALDPGRLFAAYLDRAAIAEKLGQRDAAIADYRRALSINSDLREARSSLTRLGVAP
jgi:tetratricopeptide (TPR) repeat protein